MKPRWYLRSPLIDWPACADGMKRQRRERPSARRKAGDILSSAQLFDAAGNSSGDSDADDEGGLPFT